MNLRLLIADDNEIQIESILTYVDWESLGVAEIKTAKDGMECLELAETFHPHIVITDVEMPRLDGIELARLLKQKDKRIKLIFISCHEKFEYAQKAIEYGSSAYILKPISYSEIESVAKQVIGELQQEFEIESMRGEFLEKQDQFEREFDVIENTGDEKLDIFMIQQEILRLIEQDQENEIIPFFEEKYFSRVSHQDFAYTKYMCYSIVNALQLVSKSKGIDMEELIGPSSLLWEKLASFRTDTEIVHWLTNLLYLMIKHLIETENNSYQKIVNDIKTMIDRDLYSIESVEEIARELKISSSYAKNIFKTNMGITIFDYLFEKRMKEAKKLLDDPYLKIYEVAERLGYKSKAYFSSAFQKYTGMTPNEYRKRKVQS